ncbi:MAG: type I methionyl aminopeptidase [Puniceicoccales bacterium]|jgi:methionyl aminopeptidase|nr:type I methionyl aminopeptidase [Puniceicoccales bacterium]
MIPIKTPEEIEKMRLSCRIAAEVLEKMVNFTRAGISTQDLDDFGRDLIKEAGATSTTFGYGPGKKIKYPAYSCISLNDELVHGIPSKDVILKDGDVLSIDLALSYGGFVGDNTRIVRIGNVDPEAERLSRIAEEALMIGIAKALADNRVGDISHAIEMHARENNFSVVREFVGHGVGKDMHEEPQIPNFGRPHTGPTLKAGMTLAIEPMFTQGSPAVYVCGDEWTVKTRDGLLAAHCEHTILVTNSSPEILTLVKK